MQDKYLGMLSTFHRSKRVFFQEIMEKIAKKLSGWKEKLLSQAGKETLIKTVAAGIPVYAMSSFKMPKGVCVDIASLIAKFWWGQKREKRKIH